MALCRLDVPSVMLYGGSIPPGHFLGNDVTISDVYEAIGAHATGRMSDEHFAELEAVASPGAGACGGQFTANTMAMAFEVLGISPMAQNLVPAAGHHQGPGRLRDRQARVDVLKRGLRPSDIITKASLENAIAGVACSGGSTNGVLHLLAVAREIGRRARHRRLRPRQRAHAAAVRPQARPGATSPPTCYKAGGVAGHAPAPAGRRAAQRGRPSPSPARRSASSPRRQRDRGPARRARRSTTR